MFSTIHEASAAILDGRTTPLLLLEQCFERIDRYEPSIKAWVFVDRELAREQAEDLTRELKKGSRRGPLHGIPIGVKDIYDVFDWPTAAGSKRWAQSLARADAPVVRHLRGAGAVFVGKTVTTQYASFDPPPTRNPWHSERTPGGSSSGSAAALASGMCLGALGSQTGGSITRPAAYCGVAGCKPAYGAIDKEGIVPLAASMDHPGPMATCVRDLGLMLSAMPWQRGFVAAYGQAVPAGGRAAPRLGRLAGLFQERAEPVMRGLMDRVSEQFREQGAAVEWRELPGTFSDVLLRHRTVITVELLAFHESRWRRYPDDYGPAITVLLKEGVACTAAEYARTKEHQARLREEMAAAFVDVDALLMPAATGPAPPAATTGDPAFNSPWSYLGLPSVSVPAGWTPDGLPLSIQLVGPERGLADLLVTAEWCEHTLQCERREPAVFSTAAGVGTKGA